VLTFGIPDFFRPYDRIVTGGRLTTFGYFQLENAFKVSADFFVQERY